VIPNPVALPELTFPIAVSSGSAWHLHNLTAPTEEKALELAQAQIPGFQHRIFHGKLGPQALKAQRRPHNFSTLSPAARWALDRRLGILDWTGQPHE
jgi:hypothetical protein